MDRMREAVVPQEGIVYVVVKITLRFVREGKYLFQLLSLVNLPALVLRSRLLESPLRAKT